jgi:PAS domain S-box-containing protein
MRNQTNRTMRRLFWAWTAAFLIMLLIGIVTLGMEAYRLIDLPALPPDSEVIVRTGFLVLALAALVVLAVVHLADRKPDPEHAEHALSESRTALDSQERRNVVLQDSNSDLRSSEENLDVTLNAIADGVITTDAKGCVTRLNPVAEKLTGYASTYAIGRPADEIFHLVNKQDRSPAPSPLMQALSTSTVQGIANPTILVSQDGSERDINDSCAPIHGHDHEVIGSVLVFRDVSHDFKIQQDLRDSATQVQTILNTLADGVVTVSSSSGVITSANPATERLFGYGPDEMIGQDLRLLIPDLTHGSDISQKAAARASLCADGVGNEVTGRRKDGSLLTLDIAVGEMDQGGERYCTSILRDVTARKTWERELKDSSTKLKQAKAAADKANLAKSEFLSSMSHELRSPLNAILGFAQLLETDDPPPSPIQNANIGQILHAGWYLLELINEILDLSLIESGRLAISLTPVSLTDIMLECQAMIEPQAAKRGLTMAYPRFTNACLVKADRTRLKQVLVNLLMNSIKYNKPQGKVSVAILAIAKGRLRVSVMDTGVGLSADKLAQLFQPFNRLGQEAGVEEGTGIGLVVSKRLIELMHGAIGVESQEGTGSTFWIEIDTHLEPIATADPGTIPIAEPPPLARPRPRVLLYVEDNMANMRLIEQLIARHPEMRLLTAPNGQIGIDIARASLPHAILMDINLPGISGIETMRILRADPVTAHIPIIAISANAMPNDIESGLQAGFFRYLTKPIKIDVLMEALLLALEVNSEKRLSPVMA